METMNINNSKLGGSSRKRPLEELGSRKQLLRRTEDIWGKIQAVAAEENITTSQLLGLLLTRCSNQESRDIGNSLWDKSTTPSKNEKIPVNTALVIYTDCNLGRNSYTNQKRVLAAAGHNIYPAWRHLRDAQKFITPIVHPIPITYTGIHFNGVYYNLIEALKCTVSRVLDLVPEFKGNYLNLNCKFGFDGSGGHSIFNQVNNDETNNLILTIVCPLELKGKFGEVVWTEPSPNLPKSQRPLMIQTGKESTESLQSLKVFNDDITKAEKEGFVVLKNEGKRAINVKATIVSYCLDRKAANLYLGLGGAYCDLCHHSKEDCLNIDRIQNGIHITRDIDNLHNVFNDLEQADGSIKKSRNDYSIRAGLTHRPIATNQVVSTQVLHALMRSCDMFMKIVVHLIACVFDWSESKSSRNFQFLEQARLELQQKIKDNTGIRWDYVDSTGQSGTTTTGNNCRRLLHDENVRKLVISAVPEAYQKKMEILGQRLSIILRLVSSKRKIDIEKFKQYCIDTNVYLIKEFPRIIHTNLPGPWISITPSTHKVLAHSWELIQHNDGYGLGNLDEAGLESCNKILRSIRRSLSRKISQDANLTDTLNRLWLGSDPVVNAERLKAKPFCKTCQVFGHHTRYCPQNQFFTVENEEDALFSSFCC